MRKHETRQSVLSPESGRTNRNDPIIKRALRLEEQGLAQLAKIPRFATECK